jgi:hypothetical protein
VTDKDHTQDKQDNSRSGHPLSRLDPLVGEWKVEISLGDQVMDGGKSTFEWLEGGSFLAQHDVAGPLPPDAPPEWEANAPTHTTQIIGLDDASDTFYMLYADSRTVFRVYQMSLSDGVWKIWRDAPGFYQRFTGTFSNDGNTITGQYDFSSDGTNWSHDFDLTYKKVRSDAH